MEKNISQNQDVCGKVLAGRALVENLQKTDEIGNRITQKQGQIDVLQKDIQRTTEEKTQIIKKLRHEVKQLEAARRRTTADCSNAIDSLLGLAS